MKRQNIRKAIIIISFLLFPLTIYYFSPVLVFQGMAEGIISGSIIFFGVLFVFSLFLSRLFCGWLCPAGGLQEICSISVKKGAKGGKLNWIKFFIWVPWIISIAIMFISTGSSKKVDVFYQTYYGISVAEPYAYIIYYGVVGLIVIMSFIGGKRAFCHYICWMAPFMIIGSKLASFIKLPILKLKADSSNCISCGICNKNCTMSLNVSEMVKKNNMDNLECILCGECIDNCPKKVIKYSR